jgi:hypothetical protein
VGLFAHVTFNKTKNLAVDVALNRPEPLLGTGVVTNVTPDEVVVTLDGNRGDLHLRWDVDTCGRKAGMPVTDDSSYVPGDLAEALFWLTPNGNEAIRFSARPAPAQRTEGALIGLLRDDGGAAYGFSLKRGTATLDFNVDPHTTVMVDGKPGSLTTPQAGWNVAVVFRGQGGTNLALQVIATTPKPPTTPTTPKPNTGGTGDNHGNTSGGDTHTGGDNHTPPTPPTPKPIVVKPLVVQGLVSAACDGSVFQITKADGTVLSFAVAANAQFRKSDKPAACGDVTVGLRVYVVYTPGTTNTAVAVVIVPAPNTGEHGSGGGAGTPSTGGTK